MQYDNAAYTFVIMLIKNACTVQFPVSLLNDLGVA